MKYILCHYYGPAKLTYGLKSVQRCDSSKNMVTFLKKHNQKVRVCITGINARGPTTTHHLPRQDHLFNLALKANSIPLHFTHISYH
jgi:sulfur relay (sulfurtransferase) complex TusBCD TusD component (DsrE family)